jgi:type IV pilus assembly protein PilA
MKRMPIQLRQRRRERQGGFSLIELLVVISIILIILFFAVPKMTSIQSNARETGAISTMKTIYAAQIQYQSTFNKFASTMAQLGPPAGTGGTEGPESAGLIAGSLASGESSGYLFTMTATPAGYTVSAVPKTFGTTGRRTFYLDQTGVIRQNWGQEPATATSPEAGAANPGK